MAETPDESVRSCAPHTRTGGYCMYCPDCVELSEIQSLRTRLAEAERERDKMRKVVEAAEQWDEMESLGDSEHMRGVFDLHDAVDEYRARPTG